MRRMILTGIVSVLMFVSTVSAVPPTQIRYTLKDLGGGRWQHIYDVTNHSLSAGIEEFTIWFDFGLYENMTIETGDPPAGSWDEIVWQPDPSVGSDGGYDGLVKVSSMGIKSGQTVSNFSVSFDWLGTGEPGLQYYEIADPNTFEAIDSGYTKLATLTLSDPNGGEDLMGGTPYTVRWSDTGYTESVLVEYSTDNGSSWMPVDPPNTGNSGSYNWTLPWVNSAEWVVRISDAADPNVFDVSDTLFIVRRPIFVDVDATGNNDGSGWADAYNYLQDAIDNVLSSHEIRVAEGIYTPDSNSADPNGSGDRAATFQLIDGVAIKGGYAGFGEPDPNLRDPNIYETILSGDLNGDDIGVLRWHPSRQENSYHVVTGAGSTAVLDGVTITAGHNNWDGRGSGISGGSQTVSNCNISWTWSINYYGGAISDCTGSIVNCRLIGNYGNGMGNVSTSPTVTNCTFILNSGVGMSSRQSSAIVTNCTFSGNGIGLICESSSPIVTNCVFSGNGSGISNYYYSSPTVTNCTFSKNGCGLDNGSYSNNTTINNCIFWEDGGNEILNSDTSSTIIITYSNVQGGWPEGVGNINDDPVFWDPLGPDGIAGTEDDDVHLLPDSPCIDAGDPCSPWENEPSPNGARINMGSYGNTPEATMSRAGLQFAGFKIINQTRVGRTIFRYDLSLSLTNITDSNMADIHVQEVDASPQVTNVLDGTILFPQIDANSTVDSNTLGDYFTIEVDHSRLIGAGRLTWQVDYSYSGGGGKGMQMMSALIPTRIEPVTGDFTGEGIVDLEDVHRLVGRWLWEGRMGGIPEDIVPDGTVNFADLARLAQQWKK